MNNFICTKTGKSTKNFKYEEIEVGPDHWFIHNYYLTVRLAWEIHSFHVGDIKADITKNLKIKIQIPLVK